MDRSHSRKTFPAGSTIFSEGDYGRSAYLVEQGRVEIYRGRGAARCALDTLGPNELFGEMALVDKGKRSATATALEDTVCVVLSEDDLDRALDRADPFLRNLCLVLSKRLRSSNEKIAPSTGEIAGALAAA